MAAAEYYATAHELPGTHPPQVHSQQERPPPQYQQPTQPYAQRPPQYNTSPQQQLQNYPPHPHNARPIPPYPTDPPPYFAPPQQSTTHLGTPLRPHRSRSQPPRVRFTDQNSDRSLSDSYSDSDSEASSPRRLRHHSHHSSSRELTHAQRREHKDRDTFLGAGAGALVGDIIFPGLGTAAGILLGGLGGRKYARRSGSEDGHRHRDAYREGKEEARHDGHGYRHRDAHRERKEEARHERGGERKRRHRRSDGWDEESGTYKSGLVVR